MICKKQMNRQSTFPLAVLCATGASLLSGCMALAVAPLAATVGIMANGSRENVFQVTIDEKTFTPEVRVSLFNAKSLAIVAGDRSAIRAADLFETRGGYRVTIDRPTAKVGEMTGTERREVLRKLCSTPRIDVAMMGRTTRTETGNMMMSVFTGRAKLKNDWVMDLLVCGRNTAHSFGGTFEIDAGVYNQKAESENEELIGAEIGGKILDAIGKGNTVQAAKPVATTASSSQGQTNGQSLPPEESDIAMKKQIQPTQANSEVIRMTTGEMQKRLIALGYLRGMADGKAGKNTIDALKKFQTDNQLPATGAADEVTVAKLVEKVSSTAPLKATVSPRKAAIPPSSTKQASAEL